MLNVQFSELGFIRISTNAKSSFNAPMEKARELLKSLLKTASCVSLLPPELWMP
jgi:hypothetical protein